MTTEDMTVKVTELEALAKSNKRRIEKLEADTAAIQRLATSVEVLVTKLDRVDQNVEKLDSKVEALEQKPAKRWESIVEKIIWALVAAGLGFVLAHLGIG